MVSIISLSLSQALLDFKNDYTAISEAPPPLLSNARQTTTIQNYQNIMRLSFWRSRVVSREKTERDNSINLAQGGGPGTIYYQNTR